jgi:hypothetical protein
MIQRHEATLEATFDDHFRQNFLIAGMTIQRSCVRVHIVSESLIGRCQLASSESLQKHLV